MERMAMKTSDTDHQEVSLHKLRQSDERGRPSSSAWASDEIDDLKAKLELNDLKDKLEIADTMELSLTSNWCIYKVPPKLRKVNEEAYTPCVVSIGPYHHGDKRLELMQKLKVWYLNKFLKRTPEKSIEDYFKALKYLEDEIRHCYSETIHMESNKFISMILTDACFIIEFFIANVHLEGHLVDKLWPIFYIQFDLILLENQLPFFVLTYMFDNLAFPSGFKGKYSFVELTLDFFEKFLLEHIYPKTHNKFTHDNLPQSLHLCDVLRNCFLARNPPLSHTSLDSSHNGSQPHEASKSRPASTSAGSIAPHNFQKIRDPRQRNQTMNCSHSVSQLHEAGMEFQADTESFLPQLESSKVLKIPDIVVNDFTETMLRNVIALEQCHYDSSGYVTFYVSLLDDLIDNGKDVEILVGKKIMVNLLGDSNEVASMVNKLCTNVVIKNTNKDYITLYGKIDQFCENPCHRYKAIFVREYWSTPWKKTSSIAASLLILFTLIQTICSIISLL